MQKLVWDMDPGIDDALALILALKSPEVRVLGITAVAGNAPVEITSANARRVLEHLEEGRIPVAAGAARPLRHPLEDALGYHGPDGMGDCGLPSPELPVHPADGRHFIVQSVLDAPGEIILLATGPLTNVAHAFQLCTELPRLLAGLVVMGGAYGLTPYGKGNRTPFAEFNIWQDPEAAQAVFDSGAPVCAAGLDVTMDPGTCLTRHHAEQMKSAQTPAADLTARLADYEIEHHGCCRMHDPLALAVLLDPSLFDFVSAQVRVVEGNGYDRGATCILSDDDRYLAANRSQSIRIARTVDGQRFLNMFLSRILGE